MSDKNRRCKKILELIPCYPDWITTTELRIELEKSGLLNNNTDERSQMRTIQRDLDSVLRNHTSVEFEETKPKRFQIAKDHPHPANVAAMSAVVPLKLLEGEISNMLPATLRGEINTIFQNIGPIDNKQVKLWKSRFCYVPLEFQLLPPSINESHFFTVEKALLEKKQLVFSYQTLGYETVTRVDATPLGIVARGSMFYLIAIPNGKEHTRTYALSRIHEMKLGFSSIGGQSNFDIKQYAKENLSYFDGGETIEIELLIENKRGQAYFNESNIGENQVILASNGSHTLIKTQVRESTAFLSWLMKHSHIIEVKSPLHIRNQIVERLNEAVSLYS